MWTIFFGDLAGGRLGRRDYLRYSALLVIIAGNAAVALQGLLGGLGLHAGLADLPAVAQVYGGLVGVAGLWAVVLGFLVAGLNLVAKRARDAGLSGGLAVFMLLLAIRVLVGSGLAVVAPVLIGAAWIWLMTLPTGRFGNRRQAG